MRLRRKIQPKRAHTAARDIFILILIFASAAAIFPPDWSAHALQEPDRPHAPAGTLSEAMRLDAQAIRLYRAGRYKEAASLARRTLTIREKFWGPGHPGLSTSLYNLALFSKILGRYGEAEKLYRRTLAIEEKTLGPGHPDVAKTLNNMASLYRAQGRIQEAEPLLQRALAICRKKLGPRHPITKKILTHLADLYEGLGMPEEASTFLAQAAAGEKK